jgi:hypothetical protein
MHLHREPLKTNSGYQLCWSWCGIKEKSCSISFNGLCMLSNAVPSDPMFWSNISNFDH